MLEHTSQIYQKHNAIHQQTYGSVIVPKLNQKICDTNIRIIEANNSTKQHQGMYCHSIEPD
jgi:peroxiredoxin